jgi:hypothetical protein
VITPLQETERQASMATTPQPSCNALAIACRPASNECDSRLPRAADEVVIPNRDVQPQAILSPFKKALIRHNRPGIAAVKLHHAIGMSSWHHAKIYLIFPL